MYEHAVVVYTPPNAPWALVELLSSNRRHLTRRQNGKPDRYYINTRGYRPIKLLDAGIESSRFTVSGMNRVSFYKGQSVIFESTSVVHKPHAKHPEIRLWHTYRMYAYAQEILQRHSGSPTPIPAHLKPVLVDDINGLRIQLHVEWQRIEELALLVSSLQETSRMWFELGSTSDNVQLGISYDGRSLHIEI